MSRMILRLAAAAAVAMLGHGAMAQDAAPAPTPPADYANKANWLCWPSRADACAVDLTTTVIQADGKTSVETWKGDPNAPIDCFYLYPTASGDSTPLADLIPGVEEKRVVEQQLARFGSKCRIYAPMYRQVPLSALRAGMMGARANTPRPTTPYDDSLAAWNYYLANENKGRGVVLIGHSQGSGILTRIIAEEIDGKPVQKQLISALLLGTSLPVPAGKDVGGAFKSVPLCSKAGQIGCVITYASFRDDVPPPPESRFGKAFPPNPAMEAACVNPAALGGGKAAAHAYFATGGNVLYPSDEQHPWLKGTKIATPFVSVPGLVTVECVRKGGFHFLEAHVNADPADARADEMFGDIPGPDGKPLASWGLHSIDANLTMGNLIDVVDAQSKAYLAQSGHAHH